MFSFTCTVIILSPGGSRSDLHSLCLIAITSFPNFASLPSLRIKMLLQSQPHFLICFIAASVLLPTVPKTCLHFFSHFTLKLCFKYLSYYLLHSTVLILLVNFSPLKFSVSQTNVSLLWDTTQFLNLVTAFCS